MIKNFFKIIKHEIISIFKDPGAFLVLVIGVMSYSLVYAIPYAHEVLRDVPIGVIDMDNSSFSRELIRDFEAHQNIEITTRPYTIDDGKTQLYSGKIKAYVVIPKNFGRDIFRGKPTKVSMYGDSGYLLIYKQSATGIIESTMTLSKMIETGKLMKKGIAKDASKRVVMPFEFVQIPLFNPAGGYASYIYPVVLILIMQQTLMVGIGLLGGTIVENQKQYCEYSEDLCLSIFAKSTAYVILYLIYSIFYFFVYPIIFNYSMHYNVGALLVVLVPYLYSITFLAQALLYFFKKRENSLMFMVATSLPMIFLPGFIWPKEAIPIWLRFFSDFIPATSAISCLGRINQMGASLYQVFSDYLILIGLCCLYFYFAYKTIKKVCQ